MKVRLFGKNGQVGWELQRSLAPLGEVIALDRHSSAHCGDLNDLAGLRLSEMAQGFDPVGEVVDWVHFQCVTFELLVGRQIFGRNRIACDNAIPMLVRLTKACAHGAEHKTLEYVNESFGRFAECLKKLAG